MTGYFSVNILSISDKIIPLIYSPKIKLKFKNIDFVIACGDLPYYYQEFIISSLNVPLYFVRGNHDSETEYSDNQTCSHPQGGIDLHRKVINQRGILMAGVEGSIRYKREGSFQYTQSQMWNHISLLIPSLMYNRVRYGRYLDIFVTHAPPWKIHDQPDRPHQGVKAFRWFIRAFRPKYHFHGHIHIYRPDTIRLTQFYDTAVINTYGYQEHRLVLGDKKLIGKN
jgi:Icc-related predicted phosphoesterase